MGIDDSTIIVNGAKTENESLIQKETTAENEASKILLDQIVVEVKSN